MPHIACLCGVTLLRAVDDGYGHSLYAAASSRRVTTLVELVGQVGNVQTDFGVFQYRYRRWFEMALLVVRACSRCHHSSLEAIAWLSIIDRQQAWHKQLTFTNDILAADARTWAFVFGPYSLEAPRIVARNLSREAKIRGEFAETLGKTHSSTRIPLPRRGLPKWPRVHLIHLPVSHLQRHSSHLRSMARQGRCRRRDLLKGLVDYAMQLSKAHAGFRSSAELGNASIADSRV